MLRSTRTHSYTHIQTRHTFILMRCVLNSYTHTHTHALICDHAHTHLREHTHAHARTLILIKTHAYYTHSLTHSLTRGHSHPRTHRGRIINGTVQGGWYSLPQAGRCLGDTPLGTFNCTWRLAPNARFVTGNSLRERGSVG